MANMENQVCRLQQQQQEFEIEEEFEMTEQDWAWLHKILDEEPAMANVASPSQPPVVEVEMENQHWPWQVLVAMPNVASPSQPQLQQQQQEVEMKEQDWPPQLLDQQPSASPVVYIGYQNDMQSINAELVEPPPHNLNNDSVTPSFVLEKQNKETKKPKERKQWTESEHKLFLTGLTKYGRNWKSISRYVETRTPTQVSSHAQKYFLRQQRDNKNRRPSIFDMTLPKENSTAQVMDQDVLPANKNSATAAPQPITDQVLWLNQMMQHQKYMYDVALFAMP